MGPLDLLISEAILPGNAAFYRTNESSKTGAEVTAEVLAKVGLAMQAKRSRGDNALDTCSELRLLKNIADLHQSGTIAAQRVQSLLDDAAEVSVPGSKRLRSSSVDVSGKNTARNLQRKLMRKVLWPGLYVQDVPVLDPSTMSEVLILSQNTGKIPWGSGAESEIRKEKKPKVMRPMAFLLPHELLHVLGVEGDPSTLVSKVGLDVSTQRHVTNVESSLNRAVVPLGLWADGVPLSWDRKRSMECWVMSLPGLPSDKGRQLRFPLVAYPADLQSVRTNDAIMGVLSASLVASLEGRFPVVRLDGAIFKEGDSWRKKRAGQDLAACGVVAMIRGDWKFYKDPGRTVNGNPCRVAVGVL